MKLVQLQGAYDLNAMETTETGQHVRAAWTRIHITDVSALTAYIHDVLGVGFVIVFR
jgi:hypothetical protein